jgi:hypothetical protein
VDDTGLAEVSPGRVGDVGGRWVAHRPWHADTVVTDRDELSTASPKTDLVLDITLWLQIALLALVLLQWHPVVRPFPQFFPPQHQDRIRDHGR